MNKEELINNMENYLNGQMDHFNTTEESQISFEHFLHKYPSYPQQSMYLPKIISTESELDAYYNECRNGYLYRGEADASWVCRSSLLRDFRNQIANCTDIEKFKNAFAGYAYRHIDKESAALPLDEAMSDYTQNAQQCEIALQHWGKHTSLIDFSRCKKVALYFASEAHQNGTIKNADFMKIIEIDSRDLVNYASIVQASHNDLPEEAKSDKQRWEHEDNSKLWDDIYSEIGYIEPTAKTTNPRIEAQKGVLLCLGKHRAFSLEEVVHYMDDLAAIPSHPKIKFNVVLIKTCLVDYLVKKLEKDNITHEKIYPGE